MPVHTAAARKKQKAKDDKLKRQLKLKSSKGSGHAPNKRKK